MKEVVAEDPKAVPQQPVFEPKEEVAATIEQPVEVEKPIERETEKQIKRSFFDRYVDKIKDFLDNAE